MDEYEWCRRRCRSTIAQRISVDRRDGMKGDRFTAYKAHQSIEREPMHRKHAFSGGTGMRNAHKPMDAGRQAFESAWQFILSPTVSPAMAI